MDDEELIMTTSLSYMIVSLIFHITFFVITCFDHKWHIVNRSRHLFKRYFKSTEEKTMNSGDTSSINQQFRSNVDHISSSLLSSDYILESKTIFNRIMRPFVLLLCTCLLLTNWLCIGLIYLFPKFYPNTIQSSFNLCIIQAFFLHVLILFHLHLTISLHFFCHYCFTFKKSWQTITYGRILFILLFIFICLCLFTLPSLSNEWSSIKFDKILQICIVNYTFNYSYTFFVLTFNCLIPFILLIISHRRQIRSIKNRILKYCLINERLNISYKKKQYQYSSYLILLSSFFNILFLIFFHIPIDSIQIRTIGYYIQLISFLFDPIIYIFIFRSLSIITLLRPTNEIYFI